MRRSAFTLVEVLVVIAIIGILIGILLPAVQTVREAARRASCQNNIRQIALALEHFHSQRNRYPYGWNEENGTNQSGWGWMAYSLPYVEQANLGDQIEYHIDIREPQFEQVIQTAIPILFCPSSPDKERTTFELNRATGNQANDDVFPVTLARTQYVGCIGTLTETPTILRGL